MDDRLGVRAGNANEFAGAIPTRQNVGLPQHCRHEPLMFQQFSKLFRRPAREPDTPANPKVLLAQQLFQSGH
jgi:hypothetical protein